MSPRAAHLDDLPAISAIYADAFSSERVMGELMHPYRKAFPQDYRQFWRQKVMEWYWDYGHQLLVTYTIKQSDDGQAREILTGVADWMRHGNG